MRGNEAAIVLDILQAKKDATYLSADTAGLPSWLPFSPPPLSTRLYIHRVQLRSPEVRISSKESQQLRGLSEYSSTTGEIG
ncbi:hypothetical protein ACS0PU_003698 [Formica fusca]